LLVCDAIPLGSRARLTQDLVSSIDVPAAAPFETIARDGLTGRVSRWTGDRQVWAQAELADARYLYRLRLHAPSEAELAGFADVVASVEALPVRSAAPGNAEAFAWMT